ncbi:hypothetical protein B0H14DRAFT_3433687 [Mycena olivaceomarginata]|nr:hypothetical protein B0H14DRAFT_3433687 [Mycena olivaceomarginata]
MLLGRIHDPHPPAPQSRAPFPLATAPPTGTSPQSPTLPTISAATATGTRKAPSPASPTLPASSKLRRFLQFPLTTTAQTQPLPRLLGKDEDKDARVLERQRICEAKRGARPSRWTNPSTDHCLAHVVGLRRVVFPAVCVCDCAPHFSASIPLLSRSDSSNGYGGDLTFARPPRPAWRSQWSTHYTSRADSLPVSRRARPTCRWPLQSAAPIRKRVLLLGLPTPNPLPPKAKSTSS